MLGTRYTWELMTPADLQTDATWWIKVQQESGKMHGFYTALPFPACQTSEFTSCSGCVMLLCCLYQYKCPHVTNVQDLSPVPDTFCSPGSFPSPSACAEWTDHSPAGHWAQPSPGAAQTAAEPVHSWSPARCGVAHGPLLAPSLTFLPGSTEGQVSHRTQWLINVPDDYSLKST